jgi:hypothetical protein
MARPITSFLERVGETLLGVCVALAFGIAVPLLKRRRHPSQSKDAAPTACDSEGYDRGASDDHEKPDERDSISGGTARHLLTASRSRHSSDAGDGTFSRVRNDLGMQDRGKRLDPVDQSRSGPHDDAVGIYGPHLRTGKTPGDVPRLFRGSVEMEPARCDEDDVRRRLGELLPRRLHGPFAGPRGHRFTAGGPDEIGYPVAGSERRVDPFQNRHTRARSLVDERGHRGEAPAQPSDQHLGSVLRTGVGANRKDGVEDLVQAERVEG